MRSRIHDLYVEYCVPKPKPKISVIDTAYNFYPSDDSDIAQQEMESIDWHIHIVV